MAREDGVQRDPPSIEVFHDEGERDRARDHRGMTRIVDLRLQFAERSVRNRRQLLARIILKFRRECIPTGTFFQRVEASRIPRVYACIVDRTCTSDSARFHRRLWWSLQLRR